LGPDQSFEEKDTAKVLSALKIGAAAELSQQGRLFAEVAAQGMHHSNQPGREAERLRSLAQRGAVLEQEMRRLLLAYYSVESGVLWRDLGKLNDEQLKVRWDSLNRDQPRRLAAIADAVELRENLAGVSTAQRQVQNTAGLVDLFAQKRRDPSWTRATEKAAQALSSRGLSKPASAYRTSAFDLVQLKKAEDATSFGERAFASDYETTDLLPPTVKKSLSALRRNVKRYGRELMPPLVLSTQDFYDSLLRAVKVCRDGKPEEMARLIAELESNLALDFDPATYINHLDRVRFTAFVSLTNRGGDSLEMPTEFFPGQEREAANSFLALLKCFPAEEEWAEVAEVYKVPFYARWAKARAASMARERARWRTWFDKTYQDISKLVAQVRSRAAEGKNWELPFVTLQTKIKEIQAESPQGHFVDGSRATMLADLAAVQEGLARPLPLDLTGVTVRLGPSSLKVPTDVVLEIDPGKEDPILRTPPFLVGPAAPAGTGWVGTLPLDLHWMVRPGQHLRITLHRAADGTSLLDVEYDPTQEGWVPAALTRLQAGRHPVAAADTAKESPGGIIFKVADGFWQKLDLPALPARKGS
jgi:hypothetical protein